MDYPPTYKDNPDELIMVGDYVTYTDRQHYDDIDELIVDYIDDYRYGDHRVRFESGTWMPSQRLILISQPDE